jgi:hypothetical protein
LCVQHGLQFGLFKHGECYNGTSANPNPNPNADADADTDADTNPNTDAGMVRFARPRGGEY